MSPTKTGLAESQLSTHLTHLFLCRFWSVMCSMHIIACGLFYMFDVWGLTGMKDVRKWIENAGRNLHKVLDLLTGCFFFLHPISSHFYLCNHFLSPVVFHRRSLLKALNHLCQTPNSLACTDPLWHRSFIWTSFSLTLWPLNKHEHCDADMIGFLNGRTTQNIVTQS